MIGQDAVKLVPYLLQPREMKFCCVFNIRSEHGRYGYLFGFNLAILALTVVSDNEVALNFGGVVLIGSHTRVKPYGKHSLVRRSRGALQKQSFFVLGEGRAMRPVVFGVEYHFHRIVL